MIELSVHFTSDEKDETSSITVRLFRPDTGVWTEPVPFEPPLDDKALADLRWYLEVFASWPTGPDYERAEGIKARLQDWGRILLERVTPGRESAQVWRQFCDAAPPARAGGDGKLVTIDAIEPRVLRLPWELLADEGAHLFAQGISVRRRLKKVISSPIKPFELPVRVLVVVSRPGDAGFIDPRAVSLPLLNALGELGDQAVAEFLYPPTLEALDNRLRSRTAPPVHVVHFDGHGVYDVQQGLGYLLFEDEAHEKNLVDADQLGTLLNRCGVPLMVLNACQSAAQKEEANPYASVAARLIQAGVGSVLAMNYSVLVVAARKFVEAFYGGLAGGLTVGQAMDGGRRKLLADEKRHTLTRRDRDGNLVEETVRLRDWFLPALYQQAGDPRVFDPGASPLEGGGVKAVPLALTDPAVPGGLPPDPPHGFHGRAREMLRLERALAEKAVVVLHGFGGLGKTALAAEAGRWFHRTGRFPGGAAFVSFEHGGSLQQLCSWVGQAVSGDPDFAIGDGDPAARVAGLLRQRPALVILDNFESVLGREPLMPPEELGAVLEAVWGWAVGQGQGQVANLPYRGSRVLITTRDTTFTDGRFKPSRDCAYVALEGLATADALALAAAVLDDHGIDRAAIDREALVALMERLGGHPLSLNLALPHLRTYTPAELSARFEELLPGFTAGAAVERNESLEVSLAFSLRRLGEETRAALPDLAVFQGGCMEYDLLAITQMETDLWAAARAELEAAALVTVESIPGVTAPFLRFHPTLVPYLSSQLPDDRRAELQERYWKEYYATANSLYQADTQTPHQARAVALRELPNLRRALALCLEAGAAAEAVEFADRIAKFLNNFGRWREREAMMAEVGRVEIQGEGGIAKAEYLLLSQRGEALWQGGRAAEAGVVFEELLARMQAGMAYGGVEADYDQAMTLARLGTCLAAQGRPAQAIDWHRRALAEFERLSAEAESARRMLAVCGTDLADDLAATGQFGAAQEQYESALSVAGDTDNHRQEGVILGQLGKLALRRGDLGEAAWRYGEALETFRALNEPRGEASSWQGLGFIAQEIKDWHEAERCYRESLKIEEQLSDMGGVARTCARLAIVSQYADRLDSAEQWYLRTLEVLDELSDSPTQVTVMSNLAGLYLSQGRLDEAERYARRALEIDEAIGDPSVEIWKDYSILAEIAEARGRPAEAAAWRRKEQESYAAYAGAAHQLPSWAPSFIDAVAGAVQGNRAARAEVERILPQLEEGGWHNLCHAVRRILEGEYDFEKLRVGLDREDAYIVRAILAQLSGEAPAQAAQASEVPESPAGPAAVTRPLEQWGPVIEAVVAACGGDAGAAAQLEPFLDDLARQEDWRDLAAILRRILAGERDAAALLPGLDATDSMIVRAVLAMLER